jgi:hypothetical protein
MSDDYNPIWFSHAAVGNRKVRCFGQPLDTEFVHSLFLWKGILKLLEEGLQHAFIERF